MKKLHLPDCDNKGFYPHERGYQPKSNQCIFETRKRNLIALFVGCLIGYLFWAAVLKAETVIPPWELLNLELGKQVNTSLKGVPTPALISALKRALYKYPDQVLPLIQACANAKCGDPNVIRQITEMGLFTHPELAVKIVETVYAQCPSGEAGIKQAMNSKMIREPKQVIEDEPEFDFPPPVNTNTLSFPSPPSTIYQPVTPITNR